MGKLKQKMMEEQDRIDYHIGQVMLFGSFHSIYSFYHCLLDELDKEGIDIHSEHSDYIRKLIKELFYDDHFTEGS